jgi:hypothetical protein
MNKTSIKPIYFTAKDLGENTPYVERYVWHCPYSGRNTLQDDWEQDIDELVFYEINLVGEPGKMSEEVETLYEDFLSNEEDEFDSFGEYLLANLDPETHCCFVIEHPDGEVGDYATLIYKTNP